MTTSKRRKYALASFSLNETAALIRPVYPKTHSPHVSFMAAYLLIVSSAQSHQRKETMWPVRVKIREFADSPLLHLHACLLSEDVDIERIGTMVKVRERGEIMIVCTAQPALHCHAPVMQRDYSISRVGGPFHG
jgi:hypothetical protein